MFHKTAEIYSVACSCVTNEQKVCATKATFSINKGVYTFLSAKQCQHNEQTSGLQEAASKLQHLLPCF